MAETDSEEKTKSDVYRERNLLAVAFIEAVTSWNNLADGPEPLAGWWPDTDDVNGEEWAVVWVDLPEGQVGWHVPREMAEQCRLWKRDPVYDGYSTEEKNRRVARYAGVDQ